MPPSRRPPLGRRDGGHRGVSWTLGREPDGWGTPARRFRGC